MGDHLGDEPERPSVVTDPDRQPCEEPAWTVLYDANCGFCKWLLSGLLAWDRAGALSPVALQRAEAEALLSDLRPEQRMASWHLISPAGERMSGGAAVAPLLRLLPAGQIPAAGFAQIPHTTDRGYRWVAAHRSALSRWVPSRAKRRASEQVRRREQDGRQPPPQRMDERP